MMGSSFGTGLTSPFSSNAMATAGSYRKEAAAEAFGYENKQAMRMKQSEWGRVSGLRDGA